MALDAQHRSSIYAKLVPMLGDDDTNALMSEFPDIEADELVTKQFLRAEISGLRGEMHTEIEKVNTTLERKINLQTIWLGGLFVSVVSLLRMLG